MSYPSTNRRPERLFRDERQLAYLLQPSSYTPVRHELLRRVARVGPANSTCFGFDALLMAGALTTSGGLTDVGAAVLDSWDGQS